MIVSLIIVSFVIGCVDWMCRSDVSVIPFRMCLLHHSFWPCRYEFFNLSLPVGDKLFWSDDKWNCQLVIGLRQDLQVII